jgi:hypothetical protein
MRDVEVWVDAKSGVLTRTPKASVRYGTETTYIGVSQTVQKMREGPLDHLTGGDLNHLKLQ